MRDDHDERLDKIARELKRPVRVSASLDARVMNAVRRMPKHSRLGLWSRLTTPRRIMVTPLSWGLLAAGVVLLVTLASVSMLEEATASTRPIASALFPKNAKTQSPQTVQFVLVAPDAKKVAVVGDFNGWNAQHASYQAKHRGGGVWAVTAAVPLGHHRYSFVVDDSVWVADPIAPRAIDSDFGVVNSAIVVQSQE
ncbi:MAG TPA: isoamylase early set domain-containing protein [Gemmatimonadaceae bacterium]